MKVFGKVIGLMFLFFVIMYAGEAFLLTQVLPRGGIYNDLLVEIIWRVVLGAVFEIGMITCFVLYILSKIEKNKQEILAFLKDQATNKIVTIEPQESANPTKDKLRE